MSNQNILNSCWKPIKKAGIDPKVLLHQGNHIYPSTRWSGTEVAGQAFNDLMNLWYSHYLYGIENGIENLPQVTAQDNLDPSKWRRFDKWDTNNAISARIYSKRGGCDSNWRLLWYRK